MIVYMVKGNLQMWLRILRWEIIPDSPGGIAIKVRVLQEGGRRTKSGKRKVKTEAKVGVMGFEDGGKAHVLGMQMA